MSKLIVSSFELNISDTSDREQFFFQGSFSPIVFLFIFISHLILLVSSNSKYIVIPHTKELPDLLETKLFIYMNHLICAVKLFFLSNRPFHVSSSEYGTRILILYKKFLMSNMC